MTRLTDAISWNGSDVTLILFVVSRAERTTSTLIGANGTRPRTSVRYDLEDPDRRLGDRQVHEYDLTFDHVPTDLDVVVASWLSAAIDGGGVGWFAFEGSFDFDHILTPDVADQVFAVADRHGVALGLDDEQREGAEWAAYLDAVRDRLLPA